MSRSCSFCGETSHTIRICNHPNIDVYYNRMKMIFMDLLIQSLNNEQRKILFISRLNRQFNLRELKVVAFKYIQIPVFRTKLKYIEKLWFYFYVHIQLIPSPASDTQVEEEEEEEEEEAEVVEEEEPIIWFIDRTPTAIQIGSIETIRLIEYNNLYEPAADEFLQFQPNNLLAQFDAESKKFNIVPLLLCSETKEELEVAADCPICYESIKLEDSVILNCEHKFCQDCVKQTLVTCSKANNPTCALCREPMAVFVVKNKATYDVVSELCILE